MASVLSFLAGSVGIFGACAQKAFSCQHLLFHEEENQWIGFNAQETTSKAGGPREPEAAQNLHGLMGSRGLGEN